MPVRRHADPSVVQHVWDSVRWTLQQRQQTDMSRLTRYLQKACEVTEKQAELYIRKVCDDNLLHCFKKGNKSGVLTDCFKIPVTDNPAPIDDGHDWYCIECHLSGDVINCKTCYRVFHPECAGKTKESIQKRPENVPANYIKNNEITSSKIEDTPVDSKLQGICSVCKMLQEEKTGLIEKDELNYLLNFTLNRIRIWLPSTITDVMAPRAAHSWMNEPEVAWRARQLLYQTMDVPFMEMKLRTKEYTSLSQFHADVITIQHNVAIFHGIESQEMQGSELMLTDSRYDLVELQQCIDCYRHSNEKRNEQWFCIPCRPQHQLVWAKQKGYPYWPAKVIRITADGQHDVRFFGAKHLRAVVDKQYIKPIDINVQKLQIKRTQAFIKAMKELTEYQRLLENPEEVAQIMAQTPEIKFKSPTTKSRKRLSNNNSNDNNDLFDFDESPSTPQPEKKKRGRKPGSLNKSTKMMMQRFAEQKGEGEDEDNKSSPERQENSDHVSSSTENISMYSRYNSENNTTGSRSRSTSGSGTQQLERVFCDPVENLRRQLETINERESMIKIALECMQMEIDRMKNAHVDRIRTMATSHNAQISETKKKQWCFNCEQEAIYHCCWNTAYCSTDCQQQHWQSEHKKVCRRKR